ncbi:MAG: sorbosone dehydrogenase family protein [Verrucomicrobia bacterium]|nr:sorbosone dehydrogenase family protein [Cytophagales bacterium]
MIEIQKSNTHSKTSVLKYSAYFLVGFVLVVSSCFSQDKKNVVQTNILPAPYATKSVMNFSNVIGWKKDETPKAPEGFTVTKFAEGFDNPRWMYVTPNGDILVVESNANHTVGEKVGGTIVGASKSNNLSNSANRIMLLRDTGLDGSVEVRDTFLTAQLNQPFGMLVMGDWFYVANTDALLRFPYKAGQTKITGKGEKILDLPAGKHNRHWTRNIVAKPDNSKIYIAVGSKSNVAEGGLENEILRADIIEINPDGTGQRIYASGLRNPVGMDWVANTLWVVVNERDELGDNLVPDYLTGVKEGGFYGWPYVYLGQHKDPRVKEEAPELVKRTLVPDLNLDAHSASLGLAFYNKKSFPEKYYEGAFIAQHGSWNRSILSGYKVVFVPFKDGKPTGKSEDFLTGFIIDVEGKKVHGRPVGVIVLPNGSLLVTDDVSNTLWKVSKNP